MASLKKKAKLRSILQALGDKSYKEVKVIEELSGEIDDLKKPKPSPYMDEIEVLKKQQSMLSDAVYVLSEKLSTKERVISDLLTLLNEDKIKKEDVDKLRLEILKLKQRGGGASHQQISIAGHVVSTRYADFNFIAGTGMTITARNNDLTKNTDITFTSSGGPVTTTLAVETPGGSIDSSNLTFTVSNTPLWIVLNEVTYYENDGYTLSGTTITMLVTPLTGSILRSVYQTGTVAAVETPSGTINGVNTAFTVSNTPLWITINGVTYYENNGYTLSGLNVTIDSSIIPLTGSTLRSVYKASTTSVTVETPSGSIDSSNVTFTVSTAPLWINLNGGTYFINDGYSLSSLTLTMNVTPITGSILRSIY